MTNISQADQNSSTNAVQENNFQNPSYMTNKLLSL